MCILVEVMEVKLLKERETKTEREREQKTHHFTKKKLKVHKDLNKN